MTIILTSEQLAKWRIAMVLASAFGLDRGGADDERAAVLLGR